MDKKNPKKILRQQLELLAEHSEGATEQELPNLSAAMCEIYDRLIQKGVGRSLFRSAIILVTLANLLVSMVRCFSCPLTLRMERWTELTGSLWSGRPRTMLTCRKSRC